ncbi:MAG: PcfJ domain-containing protein, partial [Planctomycetaceae bacterium]|nr:PcfJ domain-containing protein [Planctomycetaceae bacterium]
LDDVRKWMVGSSLYGGRPRLRWKKTGIGGFHHLEPKENEWSFKYWTIHELANHQELIDEGQAQNHCVAIYTPDCAKGESSIWSLRCQGALESQRVLTIEVDPEARMIVTALGECNSLPKPNARTVMELWAEAEGLKIARWVWAVQLQHRFLQVRLLLSCCNRHAGVSSSIVTETILVLKP